ncbi:MAG: putative DNA binding domain-containing protein [Bacteroidetes bacterium]|nr:putative DNA binding domain-containing protein [Bacteroidota bacterium]
MTPDELRQLIQGIETDRIEKTESETNTDKFGEAICAFANDFPDHQQPGYLILGVTDNNEIKGVTNAEKVMLTISNLRSGGNLSSPPALTTESIDIDGRQVVVVKVFPHIAPPLKFKGRIYIRVGPSKAIAAENEERMLSEKRARAGNRPFDSQAARGSTLSDLNVNLFRETYLPTAVPPDVIEANHRDIKIQMASLGFYDTKFDCPTHAGILFFGINPLFFLPGAYIQYVRYEKELITSNVVEEKRFSGDLISMLRDLDRFVQLIIRQKPVPVSGLREEMKADYPAWALRELLMNAVMHRNYDSNAPIQFYQSEDSIQIRNVGGLYGAARDAFPEINDYRNPTIAEALKNLGYVNKFSRGVATALDLLIKNGNKVELTIDQPAYINVLIQSAAL